MEKAQASIIKSINCRGQILEFAVPKIMGILNLTPDSFYDGGKYVHHKNIFRRIDELVEQKADIIDVGAFSSRPGAEFIESPEEIKRLKPALEYFLKNYPEAIVSVDTYRSEIASIAVSDYGVSIINDISAGELDGKMFETIAALKVPYIMMHMKGQPGNMQQSPVYENIIEEVIGYFAKKTAQLKALGVIDIILDPGFGFGKSILHNYALLKQLNEFQIFERPILAGFSRKSMIYKVLDCKPGEALNGTTVLNAFALERGINILRVHDVPEAHQVVKLYDLCRPNMNLMND